MEHARRYADTSPEAMEVWLQCLRRMTPDEKLAAVFKMNQFARALAETGVRSRYPGASEREVFLRVAALYLSRDEMIRAYGCDPEEHGFSGRRV